MTVGALGATYKSPNLHSPSPRHHPYGSSSSNHDAQDVLNNEEDLSGVSDLSPWSVSDDVKRILQDGGHSHREVRSVGWKQHLRNWDVVCLFLLSRIIFFHLAPIVYGVV